MPSNARISDHLETIADLLELSGANTFRVRAFRKAARTVANATHRVDVFDHDELTELDGVGKDIAGEIRAYVEDGTTGRLEDLRAEVPEGLLGVTRVRGVGPKRALELYEQLGVDGIDALEKAAQDGAIAGLKGYGAKSQENILEAIASARRLAQRAPRGHVLADVEALLDHLRAADPAPSKLEVAGSFRRGRDTVGDIDVLAVADDPAAFGEHFRSYEDVDDVESSGDTRSTVVLRTGLQVDLRVVPEESWGAALLYFTGSKDHNVRLRQRALDRNLTLNEYALREVAQEGGESKSGDPGARVAGASEAEVYAALDLPFIPPELREDRGEIAAAETGDLPDLIEAADIVSDLHMHTDYSDGRATLREMIEAARARGRRLIAITDHSPALGVTGGLSPERLEAQWAELEQLEAEGVTEGITVLRGMEVDILKDGSLDMTDAMLERMDFAIVSVHIPHSLDEAAQTERIVAALAHPKARVLAHPTGRLLGQREPYPMDIETILAAAAEHDVAVEINASPSRLDLNDLHTRMAKEAGCVITINTDAHSPEELDLMPYGVTVARRAWLEAADVLNTWTPEKAISFLRGA